MLDPNAHATVYALGVVQNVISNNEGISLKVHEGVDLCQQS